MSENAFFLITNPTLLSIALAQAYHVSRLWEVDVHVFLEDADLRQLPDFPGNDGVFVHVNELTPLLPGKLPETDLLPWVTFLRIAGPKVLMRYRRLFYIDTDVHAVRRDDALWTVPLEHGLGGVIDQGILLSSGFDTSGIPALIAPRGVSGTQYFNTGVMLIDPASWDADSLLSGLPGYFSRYGEAASLLDQDYLNHALHGRWTELSPTVNMMTQAYDLGLAQPWPPIFFHATGAYKPWSPYDASLDSILQVRLRVLYAALLSDAGLPHPTTRPAHPSNFREMKASSRRALRRLGIVSGKERKLRKQMRTLALKADEYYRSAARNGRFADIPGDTEIGTFEVPNFRFTGHRLKNDRDDLALDVPRRD